MRRRKSKATDEEIQQFILPDDGTFPNSKLPVLLYKGILDIPFLFPAAYIKNLFKKNNWYNAWDDGIFQYHHYHSITHEVMGVYKRKTTLQLGGENGVKIDIEKGDVVVIPAGVAHKNLGKESGIKVIGAYPGDMDYDMNYGNPGERPLTDQNIANVPIPSTDPVSGMGGLRDIWIDS